MITSAHIKPKDFSEPEKSLQQVIKGQTYKIGKSGKVFVLRDNDWVLSFNYPPEELGCNYDKKKRRYRNAYD